MISSQAEQNDPRTELVRIPVISLGKRSIPQFCALVRYLGEADLLNDRDWPATDVCYRCIYYRDSLPPSSPVATNDSESVIYCAAPDAQKGTSDLCLELDIFRIGGLKWRGFLSLETDVPTAVRQAIRFPGSPAAEAIDVKFVVGNPLEMERESAAYMERWRFYWNGEAWLRKSADSSLHDWNKWGKNLEFLSTADVGGLPPEKGWPPVLDVPPGKYLVRVVALEWKIGRRNEPELEWELRILEGAFKGRCIFKRAPVRLKGLRLMVQRDLERVLQQKLELDADTDLLGIQPGFADLDSLRSAVQGRAVEASIVEKGQYVNVRFGGERSRRPRR